MKHLRPLNDWSREESQFEIRGDFRGEVEVEEQRYVVPETSDEVRYVIRNVSLLVGDKSVEILFKEHRIWKGPVYVLIYQKGQTMPLRVVSVLPDNYYLSVCVKMPEQTDIKRGEFFAIVTNVALTEENANEEDWTDLGDARMMKRLKTE